MTEGGRPANRGRRARIATPERPQPQLQERPEAVAVDGATRDWQVQAKPIKTRPGQPAVGDYAARHICADKSNAQRGSSGLAGEARAARLTCQRGRARARRKAILLRRPVHTEDSPPFFCQSGPFFLPLRPAPTAPFRGPIRGPFFGPKTRCEISETYYSLCCILYILRSI